MKPSTILRALGAVALISVAATPASAQAAAQAGSPASASASAPTGDKWAAIPAGTYHLDIQLPERVMGAALTITDSSGTPTASLTPEGDAGALALKVTVKSAELTLNGQAERGLVEIVLTHKGTELDGKWAYGEQSGTLKGKQEK